MSCDQALRPCGLPYHAALGFAVVVLAGCAGLEISTLRPEQVKNAREESGKALSGYVVYEPMIVVNVGLQMVCLKPKPGSTDCAEPLVERCVVGAPYTLPDLSRPYLVSIKGGFGKAGVDVTITNGWQLGQIKDQSDNTAVLDLFTKFLGNSQPPAACKTGLYRLQRQSDGLVNFSTLWSPG